MMSEAVKDKVIEIIDRGRGPQLSTLRITVLDLIPYFQEGMSYVEIMGAGFRRSVMKKSPSSSAYYREHKAKCDEEDRLATEYRNEQIRLQKLRFPDKEETSEECRTRLRKILEQRIRERKGEGTPG